MQLDIGNFMADEPMPAPGTRDIPDGGVGIGEHRFTDQLQLTQPNTLMPAGRIPRDAEHPTACGLQLHAVVRAIAELIPGRRLLPLRRGDHLPRPLLPAGPIQHGVVDVAVADRRQLEPGQAQRMKTPLFDLGEACNPRPLHSYSMTKQASPLTFGQHDSMTPGAAANVQPPPAAGWEHAHKPACEAVVLAIYVSPLSATRPRSPRRANWPRPRSRGDRRGDSASTSMCSRGSGLRAKYRSGSMSAARPAASRFARSAISDGPLVFAR